MAGSEIAISLASSWVERGCSEISFSARSLP